MKILKEGKQMLLKGSCSYCGCEIEMVLSKWSKGPFMTKYFSTTCPTETCRQGIYAFPEEIK